MARRTRLGWLGPIIVLVGAAVAGFAIWFMQSQRPVPGAVIDTFAVDAKRTIVVREEARSDRSFVELREGDEVKWQALVPHYAGRKGRPAVAWSDQAVTVRVERNGKAEVFAFAMNNAHKLGTFKLAEEHQPITMHETGPITLTDHERSYELVAGPGWAQLIAVDLRRGGGLWKAELGDRPIIAGGVDRGQVWIEQGPQGQGPSSTRRTFDAATGREIADIKPLH